MRLQAYIVNVVDSQTQTLKQDLKATNCSDMTGVSHRGEVTKIDNADPTRLKPSPSVKQTDIAAHMSRCRNKEITDASSSTLYKRLILFHQIVSCSTSGSAAALLARRARLGLSMGLLATLSLSTPGVYRPGDGWYGTRWKVIGRSYGGGG